MLEATLTEIDDKMNKAIEVVRHELDTLRTGRASTHMLDGVRVHTYGSEMPVNQLANVSTPDAHTLLIQPWDRGTLGAIEKAILQANIGFTPNNDGQVIRLNLPPMTEETRKEMVKRAHAIAEEGRVAIRNLRRHANDEIKKGEKNHDIPEDEGKRLLDKVQKITDEHARRIDELTAAKEKEIMTV
jgi:ribosome recycling factor